MTIYVFLALVGEGFGWVLDFVRSPIYEMMFYAGLLTQGPQGVPQAPLTPLSLDPFGPSPPRIQRCGERTCSNAITLSQTLRRVGTD